MPTILFFFVFFMIFIDQVEKTLFRNSWDSSLNSDIFTKVVSNYGILDYNKEFLNNSFNF